MSSQVVETPLVSPDMLTADRLAPDIAGLQPMESLKRRWPMWLGGLLTIAMIVGLARELLGAGLAGLTRSVPGDPWFYVAFALLYLSLPVGDFIIFRKLWGVPAGALAALIKKRIANEVVLGYSGEAYFYAWARQRSQMVAAPFGAVKDVSILSAMSSNVLTLAMIGVSLPFVHGLLTPAQFNTLLASTAAVLAMCLPFLIFSKRVFSLPRATLWWIFAVHGIRLLAGTALLAICWHFGMPQVSIGMWLLLTAGRLLVWRLPLVPNKDLLFANFAILFIGQDQALSHLVAMTAALTLLVHVVLIGAFSLYSLLTDR